MYKVKVVLPGKTVNRVYVTLMGAVKAYGRYKALNPAHLALIGNQGECLSRYRVFNYKTRSYEKV